MVRGPDWKWDNQDGGAGSVGTVVGASSTAGWIEVKWGSSSNKNSYRMGADGKYDLKLAEATVSFCGFVFVDVQLF